MADSVLLLHSLKTFENHHLISTGSQKIKQFPLLQQLEEKLYEKYLFDQIFHLAMFILHSAAAGKEAKQRLDQRETLGR